MREFDLEIWSQVRNGDQGWRATVKDRYADYLEERADSCAKSASSADRIEGFGEIAAAMRRTVERRRCVARAIRRGEQPFDEAEIETMLRSFAVKGMLETEPLHPQVRRKAE